jgi:hypothetical protein
MTYHWLLITALSIAFTVLYGRYRRTRNTAYLYAALVCMMVEVEARKGQSRHAHGPTVSESK